MRVFYLLINGLICRYSNNEISKNPIKQAFICLLETKGYQYINGKELVRTSNQEVLLKDDLRVFLLKRYPDLEPLLLDKFFFCLDL